MNKGIFLRILVCILFLGVCLYSYIDLQNEITNLRIQIPKLSKQILRIEEENTRLACEIESFESPENLLALSKQSTFAHLKFPNSQEVLTVRFSDSMRKRTQSIATAPSKVKPSITFATTSP